MAATAAASSSTQERFTRQASVHGWDDAVIARQVALVLGTGGIGTNVALLLARLGVQEIILCDRDTVDASNLNRQLLFAPEDIGKLKVDAAKRALDATHAATRPTTVTAVQADFITEWGVKIRPLFDRATVVFNGCDIGEAFDLLASSAARSKGIPYCAAASYSNHSDFECFANRNGEGSCAACRLGSRSTSLMHALRAENTLSAGCEHLCFLPHDLKPDTSSIGSSILSCSCAAQFCVNAWVNGALFPAAAGTDSASRDAAANANNKFGMLELGAEGGGPQLVAFPVERDAGCSLCGDVPPCMRPDGRFALAFGSECVLLAAAAAGSKALASPTETPEQRAERIRVYREHAAAILSEEGPANVDAAVRRILPDLNKQADTTATFCPCPPVVPLDASARFDGADGGDRFRSAHLIRALTAEEVRAGKKEGLTSILTTPLIKTAHGNVHAIRSGLRSCVLPHRRGAHLDACMTSAAEGDGAAHLASVQAASFGALRIKGCGCVTHDSVASTQRSPFPLMELDPAELREMLGPDAPTRWEIRGCQFRESALREQLVTRSIADMLAPSGYLVGNYPAALWEYAADANAARERGMEEHYGRVRKFCGVFHTLGDKRAEQHALTGLDLLMALMAAASKTDVNALVRGAFPPERIADGDKNKNKFALAGCFIPYWAKKKTDPTIDGASAFLASSAAFHAWERSAIRALADASLVDPVRAASGPAWAPLWKATTAELAALMAEAEKEEGGCGEAASSPSYLAYIFERLGREMGFFHGALSASGYSWGLFFDHNPCEPHNNAHPNNFVVVAASVASDAPIAAGAPAPQYLAAVDFDMAYARDEFLSNFSGTQDVELFESNVEWERREMRSVLGGNNLQSTGIFAGRMERRLADVLPQHGAAEQSLDAAAGLRVLGREMCVLALRTGTDAGMEWVGKQKQTDAASAANMREKVTLVRHEKVLRLMLRLALMSTANLNA